MIKDRTAACFWSSGKDSCLALYKAKEQGYEIKYLVNFISQQYGRVSFHGARAELVHLQAEALGIPLLQRETTGDDYEEVFRKSLKEVKEKQVNQVVRGDIHLQELKDWVEDVCQSEGFGVVSPIWHKPAKELLNEFIGLGFKAIVTSCQGEKLDQSWVGRTVDQGFISDLEKVSGVDLCGEMGEFHSFVYDGPIFSKKINIVKTEKLLIKGYWFLDLKEYTFEKKGE